MVKNFRLEGVTVAALDYYKKHLKHIYWLFSLVLCVSLFVATKFSYTNSDDAWYAMVGRGIAEGNIMLKGWIGSSMSHYFPYGLVEAFWSLFIHKYRDVHALSIISLSILLFAVMWLTLKILLGKNPRMFSLLTMAAIVAAMEPCVLSDSFAHLAPLIPTLLTTCLYYGSRKDRWVNYLIAFLIACWSDAYCLAYFFIPLIGENVLFFLKTRKVDYHLGWVILGVAIYLVRSALMTKLGIGMFINVQDINLNTMGRFKQICWITPLEHLGLRVLNIYREFSHMYSAYLWNKMVIRALPNLYFTMLMLISLWLHHSYFREICEEKKFPEKHRFMVFLLISSLFIYALLFFTVVPIWHRYISGPFLNGLIMLAYWLNVKFDSDGELGVISLMTLLFSLLVQINDGRYRMDQRLIDRRKMAAIIRQENLHGGYAWFGNVQSMNFILNEQKIAIVRGCPCTLWEWEIDKKTFCQDKFDFVLSPIDARNNAMGWENWECENSSDVLKQFGIPKKTVDVGSIRLYIYDDITGVLEPARLCSGISKNK
ncbi:MAG: hypothetical protein LBB13_01485 [Rickettsiales bacterium]|jgi:hypothetical protein|nr:hypothetical protein [Rickettsiales bacterium]